MNRCLDCKHFEIVLSNHPYYGTVQSYACGKSIESFEDPQALVDVEPDMIAIINDPPCITFESRNNHETKSNIMIGDL